MAQLNIQDIIKPEYGDLTTASQLMSDGMITATEIIYRWMRNNTIDWCYIGGKKVIVMTEKTKRFIYDRGGDKKRKHVKVKPARYNEKQRKILKDLKIEV